MDVLSVIQKQYLNFSIKEKLIADYILKENTQMQNINISVLAKRVGVSNGIVSRFCKKIDCKNFADLKIQLSSASITPKVYEKNDPLKQVYNFYKQVVDRTNNMMDRAVLEEIANEIRKARVVYIYGIGSSGLTANEFMLRLIRMGFQGQSISDPHLMLINSSIVSERDLVLAFSVSGETVELVNAVAAARRNGCRVFCITSFEDNSLSQYAHSSLVIPNGELISRDRFYNNQFPFLYVIDLLTTMFMQDEALKEKMNITIDTIIEQSHVKK
jgi:Transcriptional regulators